VKQEIGRYAQTFLDFPPMQKGASFNLEALREAGAPIWRARL
jgi:hypothetical protein